ncbi:hypothetical protein C8J57DRAFT_1164511 [Mycena rebaudengoi]|nr:hypothetical protein C8J57DRAFT_1164511 [Mycena rebaudengoi]
MPDIVIIGAGIGGLAFAIALRRQLPGFDDFTIYEKASDVGGTWRDNIFPGASSDVGIHFYSLSTDLDPEWSSTHGSQADTQAYWRKLSHKYNIYRHIVFDHLVVSTEWSNQEQLYHITAEDVSSGVKTFTTAKIIISALGILEVPHIPKIAGLPSFKGETFHSARWDTGVDLRGKRVAVIGNGATATQFVPIISEDPTVQITEFCRTPNWFMPPVRADYSSLYKWVFRNVPFALRTYRFYLWFRLELLYLSVFHNAPARALSTTLAKNYIVQTAPKDQLDQLLPRYTLGCKRIIFDTNFLGALKRPNMSLNWDGIQSITEDGIITKKGEKLGFDVIIYSTGFIADRFPLRLLGNEGKTVQEYYESQGAPKAYIGTTIPGFPNLFLISGPNTTTGHMSVVFTTECQIDYIIKCIKPILAGQVKTIEVTHKATDAYNDKIHARLARSVHVDCQSWYRTDGGKVSSIFPGPGTLFWLWTLRPKWSDYKVNATSGWVRRQKLMRLLRRSSLLFLVVAVGASLTKRKELGTFLANEGRAELFGMLESLKSFFSSIIPAR